VKLALGRGVIAIVLAIASGRVHRVLPAPQRSASTSARRAGRHIIKQGTPTMGGMCLMACALVAFCRCSKYTTPGADGGRRDAGLRRRSGSSTTTSSCPQALAGPVGAVEDAAAAGGDAVLAYVADRQGLSTDVYLPLIDVRVELGPVYYVLLFFVVAGAANAVNLTDGLDGLAAGTVTIAMLTYTAMMVVAFLSPGGLTPEGANSRIDLAIIGAALVGGCVGFLWYNAYPADVFMETPARSGWAGRSRRWRCSPRPRCCWC
jgi:phospho-N-acetylmuramoyl-pentapeptide-transferase